jgi:hypothetical protein
MSGSISMRAGSAFDHFVTEAAKNAFAAPGAACTVASSSETATGARDMVMLTVASYRFRVLLFIHFDRDAATRHHLAELSGMPVEQMVDERFIDAMMERGNLCCGALNRELAQFFPHIGMSTPCILPGSSLEHISALQPSMTRHYRTEFASGATLQLTLAICTISDIDFPFDMREVATAASGELELFA